MKTHPKRRIEVDDISIGTQMTVFRNHFNTNRRYVYSCVIEKLG